MTESSKQIIFDLLDRIEVALSDPNKMIERVVLICHVRKIKELLTSGAFAVNPKTFGGIIEEAVRAKLCQLRHLPNGDKLVSNEEIDAGTEKVVTELAERLVSAHFIFSDWK